MLARYVESHHVRAKTQLAAESSLYLRFGSLYPLHGKPDKPPHKYAHARNGYVAEFSQSYLWRQSLHHWQSEKELTSLLQ